MEYLDLMTELALLNLTRKKLFNNDVPKNKNDLIFEKQKGKEKRIFKKIEIKEIEINKRNKKEV